MRWNIRPCQTSLIQYFDIDTYSTDPLSILQAV